MIRRLFFSLMVFITIPVYCADETWILDHLDKSYVQVSKDTDAILLFSDSHYTFKNNRFILDKKEIYHITSVAGLKYGKLEINTIKGSKVSDIMGFRYNSQGEQVEKLAKKKLKREAFSDNFHDDSETISNSFKQVEMGDYVAFGYHLEEKVNVKDLLIPMQSYIEIAYKRVQLPDNSFHRVLNDPENSVQKVNPSVYLVENQKAIVQEKLSPSVNEIVPKIGVCFDTVQERSWNDISRQYCEKIQGACQLTDETKNEIKQTLTSGNKSEFIKNAIRYVSQSVRYVDIEFGAGKFVPRQSEEVHRSKYGDCKDMTCYVLSILRSEGITAIPVLARTKSIGRVFSEFPAYQFNHMIVGVELDSDCLNLQNAEIDNKPYLVADPTDKFTMIPMLPSYLENTYILPITQDGSTLCKLKSGSADSNQDMYELHLNYHADKSMQIKLTETQTGCLVTREKQIRESLDQDEKKKRLLNWLDKLLPGSTLNDYAIELNDTEGKEVYDLSVSDYGTDVQNQIFLPVNIIEAHNKGYRQREREYDIVFSYLFRKTVNLVIEIDPAFQITAIPKTKTLDNDFFSASIQATQTNNTVTIKTQFQRKTDRIPVTQYDEFRKMYRKYLKCVKAPVVVEKT